MAASIGSHGVARYGGKDLPKPSAVVMAYTAHSDLSADEPPTFVAVGEEDVIAPPSAMERRIAALRQAGTEVEYRKYKELGHGFGPGTGTSAEEFGNVIARGGAGVVIASQSGHRLPPLSTEQNAALATTPTEDLLTLPMLQPDQVEDPLHAYQVSKRGNSLRVMAEAVRWGKRGARINTISPGIIITPLAKDELEGPRGPGYRRMIELSAAGRAGTPDEVGTVGALLMGPDGAFITGSDFLMDGGVTAAYWYSDLTPK
ncbi:SDR family oxidoreductase [Microvirga ossetica]|uniref:SDR family oxidoreductase n=1 Tax=Microvirga ossetica TaxID=1882682 RepID=UPI001F3A9670|nr:SDR family oxidoreductase [Microvirga ossetica]